MASQCTEEHPEANLVPLEGEESASEATADHTPDPKVDSAEVLESQGDQALSPEAGSQESLPIEEVQNQNLVETKKEGTEDLLGLSFPRKLWMIVENDAFKSAHWCDNGDTVVIDADLFQKEILSRKGPERMFETDSLKSFIRQLNIYGFSKIRPKDSTFHSQENKRLMIYRNCNFQKGKPELLGNICRKGDRRSPAWRLTCIPTPLKSVAGQNTSASSAKRKKLVATRHSPRFPRPAEPEGNQASQREAPEDQGTRGPQPFLLSGVWAMSSVPERPLENQPPQEPPGPSGEGTSGNVPFACPPVAARMEGEGEVSSTSPAYPDYASVMSLYNTCYSILLAALSAMSPREPTDDSGEDENDDDDEEEGDSDYKCALCEQFKENTSP